MVVVSGSGGERSKISTDTQQARKRSH